MVNFLCLHVQMLINIYIFHSNLVERPPKVAGKDKLEFTDQDGLAVVLIFVVSKVVGKL